MDAGLLNASEDGERPFVVLEQDAFGDLEFDQVGRDAGLVEYYLSPLRPRATPSARPVSGRAMHA